MDYAAVNKEHHDRLEAMAEEIYQRWTNGAIEEARALGEQYWEELPEPKHNWDWLSQVTMYIAEDAAKAGYPADARRWLERAELWAERGVLEDNRNIMTMTEGMILVQEGDLDAADERFTSVYQVEGKRAFDRLPEQYWDFFAERHGLGKAKAKGSVDLEHAAAEGEERFDAGDIDGAITIWQTALESIDDPHTNPDAFWFLVSLADAHHSLGNHPTTERLLHDAINLGGTDNAFVWLRLGQAQYDQGNHHAATQSLITAHMLDGEDIWEDEDPKYRQHLANQGLIQ